MSILIQSREPAAPPLPDRDVWVWNIPGMKNAVVVEQRPSGYAVAGPLLFPDNPFVSEPLNATTTAGAIVEARAYTVAVLTRRAEENMALANAFAADGEPEPDDDSTLELDQAEVAAAMAVALGERRVAYSAGV